MPTEVLLPFWLYSKQLYHRKCWFMRSFTY